jgi:hypothetical protein
MERTVWSKVWRCKVSGATAFGLAMRVCAVDLGMVELLGRKRLAPFLMQLNWQRRTW